MNKTTIFLFISLFFSLVMHGSGSYSQEHKGIILQQINYDGSDGVLDIQSLNKEGSNVGAITQTGNGNRVDIHQVRNNSAYMSNRAVIFQQGDNNTVSANQKGAGNKLKSIQGGYMFFGMNMCGGFIMEPGFRHGNSCACSQYFGHYFMQGNNNQLISSQSGSNNDLFSLQQGNNNSAEINQNGVNNKLFLLQKGSNNTLKDHDQTNIDPSHTFYEPIIQIGIGNTLSVKDNSHSKQSGNKFCQEGTNLSLHYYNNLFNTPHGVEVHQTGRDMKIAIDRSYFSLPGN